VYNSRRGPSRLRAVKTPPADLAERLWKVADRALQQDGELRIDGLAELSGVPRATLYYYFAGKDDVLAFLLAQQLQRGTATIDAAVHSGGGPAERLAEVVRAMLRTMAQHPALCTRLMGGMANGVAGAELMAEVERTLMAPVRDLLVQAQESGDLVVHDPMDTTLSLVGAVAITAMVRTATGSFDADDVADRLIPQFLDGLRPRDCSPPAGDLGQRHG
jgi:AcrR family transcriptional regulator